MDTEDLILDRPLEAEAPSQPAAAPLRMSLDEVLPPAASLSPTASSSPDSVKGDAGLVVSLGAFEGPIDLLLHLSREQKLDLSQISILSLVNQYLDYIDQARELRLEIAADYLVMAAWMAYLKSRLLLPKQEQTAEEEPSGEELAAALAWQMRRLESMQKAASELLSLPQMGITTFRRGLREDGLVRVVRDEPQATIYDLMSAYASIKRRSSAPPVMKFAKMELFSIEEAVDRLRASLGAMPSWTTLSAFLPRGEDLKGLRGRSALASTLIASLELAKQGLIEVRQDVRYGPIFLRRVENPISYLPQDSTEMGAYA